MVNPLTETVVRRKLPGYEDFAAVTRHLFIPKVR
jgi:hypothetical protein